jgi:hypothetical protein
MLHGTEGKSRMKMQRINRIKFNNMTTILRFLAVLILWTLMVGQAQAQTSYNYAVYGNGILVGYPGDHAHVANGTDYGSATISTTVEHEFVLRNLGTNPWFWIT